MIPLPALVHQTKEIEAGLALWLEKTTDYRTRDRLTDAIQMYAAARNILSLLDSVDTILLKNNLERRLGQD